MNYRTAIRALMASPVEDSSHGHTAGSADTPPRDQDSLLDGERGKVNERLVLPVHKGDDEN